MRLKIGIFASSGGGSFFQGIVNWLIGADTGILYASQDGTTFAQINAPIFGTSNINDVGYLNNQFWVIGDSAILANSTDGLTWTTRALGGTNNYQNIAYGNNIYYAGGT
jgi:photosystem II stability/assembly factor-like uncharacterized protein